MRVVFDIFIIAAATHTVNINYVERYLSESNSTRESMDSLDIFSSENTSVYKEGVRKLKIVCEFAFDIIRSPCPIMSIPITTSTSNTLCSCGCVFWADDEDIKFPSYSVMREYAPGLKLAECPECGEQVASCLPEVPREKIFVD